MALDVPDDLWAAVAPRPPPERPKPRGGRPRAPDRAALAGVLFVLRTGAQWREVPAEPGCSGKTCWRRLCERHAAGVWARLHRVFLHRLHAAGAIDRSRASLGSASVRARRGAKRPGRTRPTAASRARSGTSSRTRAAPRSA
jgi:transposase